MPRDRPVRLTSDLLTRLVEEAERAYPAECCGILRGDRSAIEAIQPARNVHPTPRSHFEIDPQALIDAHRDARGGGLPVAGYYHSHPEGRAVPSQTDQAMSAGDNSIWAIIAGEHVRLFLDGEDGFTPLPYVVSKR
ncbi:M67 family metallopeptidase [Qipengyuania sp. JC766]|uniref:M67 family metallopeptidase n=1 Tax=Qipengyuania sp. JC766 TaxID=3232139 RepID=UPI00345A46B6